MGGPSKGGFKDVPLDKYFNCVSRSTESLLSTSTLEQKIKWLKSLTSYTDYVQNYKLDPLEDFEKSVIKMVAESRGIRPYLLSSSDIVLQFGHKFEMALGKNM
jgi:hypothetical protein